GLEAEPLARAFEAFPSVAAWLDPLATFPCLLVVPLVRRAAIWVVPSGLSPFLLGGTCLFIASLRNPPAGARPSPHGDGGRLTARGRKGQVLAGATASAGRRVASGSGRAEQGASVTADLANTLEKSRYLRGEPRVGSIPPRRLR